MAVDALQEIITSESTLVVAAIEALTNFNLPSRLLGEITGSILTRLSSSPFEDLPILVRFLMQSATTSNMIVIVQELREKLSRCIVSFNTSNSTDGRDVLSGGALLLTNLVQGISFRSDISTTFFKVLTNVQNPEDHYILDIWFLFGAHSISMYKSKAEQTLKKKVLRGLFKKELFVQAIAGHSISLKGYFQSLVQIAGCLLTSNDIHSSNMGCFLFELVFDEFSVDMHGGDDNHFHRSEVLQLCIVNTQYLI